jgi:plasmid stabilization system protein ParE
MPRLSCQSLLKQPSRSLGHSKLGRIVPELGDAMVRERLVHRYRLIYRLEGNRIVVAAIIHGRQDFQSKFPRSRDDKEI